MSKERGSTTIMAIIAMLVLAAGSTSYIYVANRNLSTAAEYNTVLQAQYSAEAAVRTVVVAGQESLNPLNSWVSPNPSALDNWLPAQPVAITLPGTMGTARVSIAPGVAANSYNVQALSNIRGVSRLAYNNGVNIVTGNNKTVVTTEVTIASLIQKALAAPGTTKTWSNNASYTWTLPANVNDKTSPALSPGSGTTSAWTTMASQVLFDDTLGYSDFAPATNLQMMFRTNYYITLTNVPTAGGSGYGVYYLAKKDSLTSTVNAGDPTSYIVQFDPGLHPGYGSPAGGTAWGAAFGGNASNWPYGAFLVKKTWADGTLGWQNEVWDEGGTYNDHCGFQDNNELTQRYYDSSWAIQPTLPATHLSNDTFVEYTTSTGTGKHKVTTNHYNYEQWALQDYSLTPGTSAPTVKQVPAAFGYNSTGTFTTELTAKYRTRPPDLRIPYTLGNLAEGNPWQANTYYPLGAKVAVGVYVSDPLDSGGDPLNYRMVWVATVPGLSGGSKPAFGSSSPTVGTTVQDNGVTWIAQLAPTPEAVANAVLTYSPFSIAKISMADLNFRVNTVNGTTDTTDSYNIPFTMLQGSKNKITVELWTDTNGNRIHLIRVNDVLVLAFNDKAGKTYDIIPLGWESNRATDPRSTGIRVWNAAAAFYTADNYGVTTTINKTTDYGTWGK